MQCCFAVPTVKNVDEENVLHSAIQSGCRDSDIAKMAGLLLFNRYARMCVCVCVCVHVCVCMHHGCK